MVTIYNNYCDWISDNEVMEFLVEDCGMDREDITDSDIYNERRLIEEAYWEDAEYELKKFFNNGNAWLLTGTLSLWDGNHRGGFIFSTFDEFVRCLNDCEYIKIVDDDGHLHVQCSHHDGTNYFEIKELTECGGDWYEANQYDYSDRELHDILWESNMYTKIPHFAERVYG